MKLVEHAIKETDKWVKNDTVLGGSIRRIELPGGYNKDYVCSKVPLYADGLGAEIEAESTADTSAAESDDVEEISRVKIHAI